MQKKSVRRSVSMTPEMGELITQLIAKQPRDISEAEIIREAIRQYIDTQEDIIGSRKHFQKSLQERIERLEVALAFHLNVLIYLVAALDPESVTKRIAEAIIAAKRDGVTLLEQIHAVREMK